MKKHDSAYYRLRAAEERGAAEVAESAAVSAAHQEIATQYDTMAEKAAGRPILSPHYNAERHG